jgi:23S rRNA (pseudouridine1915-N3)-methyltransferase
VLKIKIIVVDRTRSAFLSQGESFYLDRLKRYARIEWLETKPARITKGSPVQRILDQEGNFITKKLQSQDYAVALDRTGKAFDSEGLAAWIDRLSISHNRLAFVIGGPLGLSKTVLSRANETLSLSRMTLTHEMSRLVLLEQIYRAFTIINNEKYHK